MMHLHVWVPGDPAARTGGSLYNAAIVSALRRLGLTVTVSGVDGPFPQPAPDVALPEDIGADVVLVDGLMAASLGRRVLERAPWVVVHSPLHWEHTTLGGQPAEDFERAVLQDCAGIITTGVPARDEVCRLLSTKRPPVYLVPPGTEPAPRRLRTGPGTRLLCLAQLHPRKDYPTLFDALRRVSAPCTLTCAGAVPDASYARWLYDNAPPNVRFVGLLDHTALAQAYDTHDLLVLTSRREAYGMVLTEAVATGMPVVTTPAGAIHDLGPAAVVVPPGDAETLAQVLRDWLTGAEWRAQLRVRAQSVSLPTWDDRARELVACLQALRAG